MTTTTALCDRGSPSRAGFTLTEILISTSLGGMIMAGVLSAFVFIGKTSVGLSNYSELEAEARRGLEMFSQDARQARDVTSFSATQVVLTVPTASSSFTVTYGYDATDRIFYRQVGAGTRKALISNIEDFSFSRYDLQQNPADNNLETKQLQLYLKAVRRSVTRAADSNTVLSARFILRNKKVST